MKVTSADHTHYFQIKHLMVESSLSLLLLIFPEVTVLESSLQFSARRVIICPRFSKGSNVIQFCSVNEGDSLYVQLSYATIRVCILKFFFSNKKNYFSARGWGEERKRVLFNGYRVSVLQNEKLLEICCTTIRIQLTSLYN